jgi:hypothetical protein
LHFAERAEMIYEPQLDRLAATALDDEAAKLVGPVTALFIVRAEVNDPGDREAFDRCTSKNTCPRQQRLSKRLGRGVAGAS